MCLPNVGAGVYYYSDKLFAGLSVPQFLSYQRTGKNTVEAYHSFHNYDFIFTAGGLITFSDFLKFKPSMLVNYSLQETKKLMQLDINGNFILGDLTVGGRVMEDHGKGCGGNSPGSAGSPADARIFL